jgi:FtsH-binding integral membrane protein
MTLTFKIFTQKETSHSKGLFYTLLIAVFVQIAIACVVFDNSYWKVFAVGLGVLGYGCFLILNTNKISNELPLDEYILGSLLLYIDILTLFVYLLKQFGKKKS